MRTAVLEDGKLIVVEGELRPTPGLHQVLVQIKACVAEVLPQKSLELFHSMKHHYPVGHEISGAVTEVGAEVGADFQVGMDVVAFLPVDYPRSGMAEYALVDSCWASRIPAECSPAECAAMMRPGLQAYTALHYQLRIAKGDSVLVTRGCYEGRQAIIQMAAHWGGRVFATAYGRDEVHALVDVLDESQIIDLASGTPLVSTCMELSSGLGWDCIVDGGEIGAKPSDSAPSKHEILSCLAAGGKWITMVPDVQLDPPDSQLLHWKGASLCFLNEHVWNLSGAQQGRYLHVLFDILCKLRDKTITPRIAGRVPFSSVAIEDTTPAVGGRTVVVFDDQADFNA
eukprot:CAMPEP_0182930806 /NCGR_PEP_ID=MMETSP0105_2-20130417/26372_1 /TAXON_ID=81532 ORGANISM="Acanthoeca-like sp., Strain 10tr" /NCGR_SAMPLE_ID=MMETSP0105_2 /ASSEMBLY_ACC=CAM_ASM_000205 /LENGTH=340 /DNA_ID=CAMNT_0025069139 /DNA_START=219 /DNA_END=1239 /DNA_ORIENTATION=-